jgi:hypothetical protein
MTNRGIPEFRGFVPGLTAIAGINGGLLTLDLLGDAFAGRSRWRRR